MTHETMRQQALDRREYYAEAGDPDACFDLGMACSTGSGGIAVDLVAAHKWFNIAAAMGHARAAECRGEIAEEMSAREVVDAQRQARALLATHMRRAA
ncbi:hypothetical protein PQ455_13805 [Sphingomonas naphthae]|uniref:Sel1 repeat family protein n=1 Tax=Sphingomonas naphthae TaxID=1813468 RepID=A0ABY7TJ04_9SPHN|nr:hypothetical protein [Sphingomonas naphthae]WCT72702.1 hypothetical protein PQ455_13805 [Sphingomonas naphthae]